MAAARSWATPGPTPWPGGCGGAGPAWSGWSTTSRCRTVHRPGDPDLRGRHGVGVGRRGEPGATPPAGGRRCRRLGAGQRRSMGFVSICDVADDAAWRLHRPPPAVRDGGPSALGAPQVVIDDRGGAGRRPSISWAWAIVASRCWRCRGRPGRRAARWIRPTPAPFATRSWPTGWRARDAVEDAGLSWDTVPALVVPDDQSPRQAARELAGILLERPDRPTGVVAMSDELAAGVVDAAGARGIEVPRELSVVGFDDTPTATSTALRPDHHPSAARSARGDRRPAPARGVPAKVVEFPTELVVRCSTTRAPT